MSIKNRNEKKIYLLMFLSCFIAFTAYNHVSINHKKDNFRNYVDDIYEMYKYDVDGGISFLFQSKEFQSKAESERVEYVHYLLNRYESSKELKNLYYSDTHKMFSFELKDGTLHGVMMRAFDPYLN